MLLLQAMQRRWMRISGASDGRDEEILEREPAPLPDFGCGGERRGHYWVVAALTLVAFGLRVYRIDVQSIWWDEGISVRLARLDVLAILSERAGSQHPPLYYLLLHLWGGLAGYSEFGVRFLSLLFGVLLVPAVFRVMDRLFDRGTGLLCALLVAANPAFVVYSQEARVYNVLPLVYLLILRALHSLVHGKYRTGDWWGLALWEALALYLHYFSVFALFYLNMVIAVLWWRRRERVNLRHWGESQLLVGGAMLPWLVAVSTRWGDAGAKLSYRQLTQATVGPIEFARNVWHFFNGGKIGLIGETGVFATLSGVLGLVSLVCLVVGLSREERKERSRLLVTDCVIPLAMTYVAWWWRPGSHPRYVLMYGLPIVLLLGRVSWTLLRSGGMQRALGILLVSLTLAVYGFGLNAAYHDHRYYKDDTRSLGLALQAEAGSDDAVVVDWNDYAVEYYYRGPAPIVMVPRGQVDLALGELSPVVAGRRRVFLVHNYKSIRGLQGFVPCLLELNGSLVGEQRFQGYSLRRYDAISPTVLSPTIVDISEDFGFLRLTGVYVQEQVTSDDAVGVGLRCVAAGPLSREYAAAVRVVDPAGHVVGEADLILLNGRSQTTSLWDAGEEGTTYGVVPIPPGTPPIAYDVLVRFYERETLRGVDHLDASGSPIGQTCRIGEVSVGWGGGSERDAYGALKALNLNSVEGIGTPEGLVLEGYRGSGQVVIPGQKYKVTLKWRSLSEGLPYLSPRVVIRQGDTIIGVQESEPVGGLCPTPGWRAGEVILDRRDVAVSAFAQDGGAILELELGGERHRLADLTVKGSEHVYEMPSMEFRSEVVLGGFAELLGYDLDTEVVSAADPVPLTLYWRVTSDSPERAAYTVFTHLLDEEGKLIGQHDGPPAGGRRATPGWIQGEIITDRHDMIFRDSCYEGNAWIEVGMYDPATLDRAGTSFGTDRILLPNELTVQGSDPCP